MKRILLLCSAICGFSAFAHAGLINGDFSNPSIGSATPVPYAVFAPGLINAYSQADVPGWTTTDINGAIEIWLAGASGVPAYNGLPQFAELNAYSAGTLSQVVSGLVANSSYGFSFAHRGRLGVDVMQARFYDLGSDNAIGGGDDILLYSADFSDGNTAWGFYEINFGIKPNNNNVLLQFESISNVGVPGNGNFLTAVRLDNGVASNLDPVIVPEPSTFALLAGALGLLATRRLP